MILVWLCVFLITLIAEIITVQLISLPFVIGSIIAIIAAYFNIEFSYQVFIFALCSFITLIVFQVWVKKDLRMKQVKTNVDSVIGANGFVVEAFDPQTQIGRVVVNSVDWRARSDKTLAKDVKITVVGVRGATLIVKEEQ